MEHPPKPILTLRVAFVGQDLQAQAPQQALVDALQALFAQFQSTADAAHADNKGFYADRPSELRLLTGLSPAADELAVQAKPKPWSRHVVETVATARPDREPVPGNDGIAHTGIVEERESFAAPSRTARPRELLLRNADVLVVLWDKDKADNATAVVLAAYRALTPVIFLSAIPGVGLQPRLLASIDHAGRLVASADPFPAALTHAFKTIVDAPGPPSDDAHSYEGRGDSRARLQRFLHEARPGPHRWFVYKLFKNWFDRSLARRAKASQSDPVEKKPALPKRIGFLIRPDDIEMPYKWREFLDQPQNAGGARLRDHLRRRLMLQYGWADILAVYYSDIFRSAFFLTYCLSAVAVLIALASLFIQHEWAADTQLWTKAAAVLLEFGILGYVLWLVRRGQHEHWHDRWLDYRALAESLRHVRSLVLVGLPARRNRDLDPLSSGAAWILWYVRACAREIDLPGCIMSTGYLKQVAGTVREYEVESQINYNKTTAASNEAMHHFVHRLGNASFVLAIGLLGVFLLGFIGNLALISLGFEIAACGSAQSPVSHRLSSGIGHCLLEYKLWFAAAAAFLPAFGAAMAGIRTMADFEGFAKRARATEGDLANLKTRFTALEAATPHLEETSALLLEMTETLSQDMQIWHALYGQKPLTLPA